MRAILVLVGAVCLVSSSAAQTFFGAVLDGSQVVPASSSARVAEASFVLTSTPAGPRLTYVVLLPGLDLDGLQTSDPLDDVTAIRLRSGVAGANGASVLNVFGAPSHDDLELFVDPVARIVTGSWDNADAAPGAGPGEGSVALRDALVELATCGLYVQVDTGAAATGELRGQISAAFVTTADGQSVVPPTASTRAARATFTLRATAAGPVLDYLIRVPGLDILGTKTPSPLDDLTAVHVHVGAPGSDGPHVLNVFGAPSQDDAQLSIDAVKGVLRGSWDDGDAKTNPADPVNASTRALSDVLLELARGELYVQLHTKGFHDGELRGQIQPGAPLPGSGEDFRLATGIDGAPVTGPCATAKRAGAGDLLTVAVTSPGGGFASGAPLLLGQLFTSGLVPVGTLPVLLPDLGLDPFKSIFLFDGVAPKAFGQSVIGQGIQLGFVVLPGLSGSSLRLQAAAFSPLAANGILALSEAHDIVFE